MAGFGLYWWLTAAPPPVPVTAAHMPDLANGQEMFNAGGCASCHAVPNQPDRLRLGGGLPIGSPFGTFFAPNISPDPTDGIGRWRAEEKGHRIDPSGKLPDGSQFDGPAGLRKLLLTEHRIEFAGNVTEKLLTYALGRGLEHYDKPVVRSILRETSRDNHRMVSLITAIAKSTPFQMRRTVEK